jgi:hypothetical protein
VGAVLGFADNRVVADRGCEGWPAALCGGSGTAESGSEGRSGPGGTRVVAEGEGSTT